MPRVKSVRIGTRFLRCALWRRDVSASLFAAATPAAGQVAGQTVGQTGMRALSRLEQESVNDALASARHPHRSGARRARHGTHPRRQPGGVLAARLVVSVVQHLSPHHARLHHRARAADQARRALRPGAGRGEHAQPAGAAGRGVAGRTLPRAGAVERRRASCRSRRRVPGQVDLLVVTRDVWSLRFNTNFEYQGNTLSLLRRRCRRTTSSAGASSCRSRFNCDQGDVRLRPDLLRSQHRRDAADALRVGALLHLARDRTTTRATPSCVSLHYPLFSLASRWGGGVDVIHQNASSAASAATACARSTWRGRRDALRVPAPRPDRRRPAPCGRGAARSSSA